MFIQSILYTFKVLHRPMHFPLNTCFCFYYFYWCVIRPGCLSARAPCIKQVHGHTAGLTLWKTWWFTYLVLQSYNSKLLVIFYQSLSGALEKQLLCLISVYFRYILSYLVFLLVAYLLLMSPAVFCGLTGQVRKILHQSLTSSALFLVEEEITGCEINLRLKS